jgi:hypothetical protein
VLFRSRFSLAPPEEVDHPALIAALAEEADLKRRYQGEKPTVGFGG